MYDDYDFNQDDDFQRLIEGRCSDDEEYFKQSTQKSTKKGSTSKSAAGAAKKTKNTTKNKSSLTKQLNQRKNAFDHDDDDSNSRGSLVDLRDDNYDRLDKYEKYDKYDDYDKYSDDDPVNPFDECEEEPAKQNKSMKEADDADGEEKAKRKNIIRNPRVLINDEKLKSSDGVIKLPELFKDVKLKGKNYEKDDLNRIMSVYQNWAHRLMPSLQFDDFIEKTELLCRKAKMKVFLTKIRNGMPLDIRGEQRQDDDNEIINQFDDSDQDDLMNNEPKLVPRNMEDEFMDDDFMMNEDDNKLLNEQLVVDNEIKINKLDDNQVHNLDQLNNKDVIVDQPLQSIDDEKREDQLITNESKLSSEEEKCFKENENSPDNNETQTNQLDNDEQENNDNEIVKAAAVEEETKKESVDEEFIELKEKLTLEQDGQIKKNENLNEEAENQMIY